MPTVLAISSAVQAAGPRKLVVTSLPAGASVTLGGEEVDVTPLTVEVPAKGKHLLRFTAAGCEPLVRRVDAEPDGATVQVKLADLARLERESKRAQVDCDRTHARLETAQEAAAGAPDSTSKQRAVETAGLAMSRAAESLEEAERALSRAKDARLTDTERAATAAKVEQTVRTPPKAGVGAPAPGVTATAALPTNTVFCAWQLPVREEAGRTWTQVRNRYVEPPPFGPGGLQSARRG